MEKTKFLPGPWRVERGKKNFYLTSDSWDKFCKVYAIETIELKVVAEANVRLIAAAPEMFLVIQDLLAIYKKYANDNPQEDATADFANELLNRITGVERSVARNDAQ